MLARLTVVVALLLTASAHAQLEPKRPLDNDFEPAPHKRALDSDVFEAARAIDRDVFDNPKLAIDRDFDGTSARPVVHGDRRSIDRDVYQSRGIDRDFGKRSIDR